MRAITLAVPAISDGGRRGDEDEGMVRKIWLFNGVGWMVNLGDVRVLALHVGALLRGHCIRGAEGGFQCNHS